MLRLLEAAHTYQCQEAQSVAALGDMLLEQHYDAVVLLADEPERALKVLETIKDQRTDRPVLLIAPLSTWETGTFSQGAFTSGAIEAGASACLDAMQLENATLAWGIVDRTIRFMLQAHRMLKAYRDQEKNKELFYATLAHDLKTPIIAEHKILTHLQDETFGPLNEAQREVVAELIHSNHYLTRMVSNLLSSYRYQQDRVRLKRAATDYQALLEKLLQEKLLPLTRDKKQTIQLVLEETLPVISIDPLEIQRVVFNLTINAIHYSPENSQIVIRVCVIQKPLSAEPSAECLLNLPERFIKTTVEDHGPGIQSEQIPKLFQPYATSKTLRHVGTGLGLYLSRQIVEAHGGHIGVNSIPGKGSAFYFRLPI